MVFVDKDAPLRIDLFRLKDSNEHDYFIGKLQFPGTLEFEDGCLFIADVNDLDKEELQILPVNRKNLPRNRRHLRTIPGKFHVDMIPDSDQDGRKVYVGELKCPAYMRAKHGLFFTLFLSRDGEEELQIGKLENKKFKTKSVENIMDEDDSDVSLENFSQI